MEMLPQVIIFGQHSMPSLQMETMSGVPLTLITVMVLVVKRVMGQMAMEPG